MKTKKSGFGAWSILLRKIQPHKSGRNAFSGNDATQKPVRSAENSTELNVEDNTFATISKEIDPQVINILLTIIEREVIQSGIGGLLPGCKQ
jgi:hypothetical protein